MIERGGCVMARMVDFFVGMVEDLIPAMTGSPEYTSSCWPSAWINKASSQGQSVSRRREGLNDHLARSHSLGTPILGSL